MYHSPVEPYSIASYLLTPQYITTLSQEIANIFSVYIPKFGR